MTVEEAEQELAKAIEMEQEIAGELAAIEKQLSEAESTAGERSLAARKTGDQKAIGKINDDITKLRSRRDVSLSTHGAARRAIKDARHAVNVAKAGVLRAEAAKINEGIGIRSKKTRALLQELRDHEGVGYIPEPQKQAGAYLAGTFAETKTAKLAQEAAALIQRAESLERQVCHVEPAPSTGGRKSNAIFPNSAGVHDGS